MNGHDNIQLDEANKSILDLKKQINLSNERERNLNVELERYKSENTEWNVKTK